MYEKFTAIPNSDISSVCKFYLTQSTK